MIRLHFYLQCVLCAVAILLALPMLFGYETFVFLFYWQFLVGIVQYFASVSFALQSKYRTLPGLIHLGVSTLYLIVLLAWSNTGDGELFWFLLFGFPWSLAVVHWYVSYKLFLQFRK